MEKHPLSIAFDNWKLTEEGKGCHNADSLNIPDRQVYLANRLYRAFFAGAQAQFDIDNQKRADRLKIVAMRVLAYQDRLPADLVKELKNSIV